jgi:hypothetical protein
MNSKQFFNRKINISVILTVLAVLILSIFMIFRSQTMNPTTSINSNQNNSKGVDLNVKQLQTALDSQKEDNGLKISQANVEKLSSHKTKSFQNRDALYQIRPNDTAASFDFIQTLIDKYFIQNNLPKTNNFFSNEPYYLILDTNGYLKYIPQNILYISEFEANKNSYWFFKKSVYLSNGESELYISKPNFIEPKKVNISSNVVITDIVDSGGGFYVVVTAEGQRNPTYKNVTIDATKYI